MKYRTRERRDPEDIARKDMIDLQWILYQAESHSATDLRDKFYSVLALIIDTGESGLRPVSTLPVREGYITTAQHIMKRSKDMILLYPCFNRNKLET